MSKGAKSLQEDQEGEAREAEEKPGESSVTEARTKPGRSFSRRSSQYCQVLQRTAQTRHKSYTTSSWECVLPLGKIAYNLENFPKLSPHPNGNVGAHF